MLLGKHRVSKISILAIVRTPLILTSSEHLEDERFDLQGWLEELYFDPSKSADMTRKDIVKLGALLRRLLSFAPQRRVSTGEILEDEWFQQ